MDAVRTVITGQVEFSSAICFCTLPLLGMNPREALSHLSLSPPKVGSPSCKSRGNGKSVLARWERAEAAPEMVKPVHQLRTKKVDKEFSPLKELGLPHGHICFFLPFSFLAGSPLLIHTRVEQ